MGSTSSTVHNVPDAAAIKAQATAHAEQQAATEWNKTSGF